MLHNIIRVCFICPAGLGCNVQWDLTCANVYIEVLMFHASYMFVTNVYICVSVVLVCVFKSATSGCMHSIQLLVSDDMPFLYNPHRRL